MSGVNPVTDQVPSSDVINVSDESILRMAFSLISSAYDESQFKKTCFTLTAELASKLNCEQVVLAIDHGKGLKISAMSHQATWDSKTKYTNYIINLMEECCEQEKTLIFPLPAKDANKKYVRAHKSFSAFNNNVALLTVPLVFENAVVGAISLQRAQNNRFDPLSIVLTEIISTIIGPNLLMKYKQERWIVWKNIDALSHGIKSLIGPNYMKRKLVLTFLLGVTIFLSISTTQYNITSDAFLEGKGQKTVSIAEDGFLQTALVKVGHSVSKNQVLAKLDSKELDLALQQLKSQKNQLKQQYQQALVDHDRSKVSLFDLKLEQIETEININLQKQTRLLVTSPIDGIIIEGDVYQSIGKPVKKGEEIFKISPLRDYRVILKVDESDIAYIKEQQKGHLLLSSFTNEDFAISVSKITPMSIAKDGNNTFRVEATLSKGDDRLKPNMAGLGKIAVGSKKRLWIVTHEMLDWAKIKLWPLMD